jgi:hypothetical protein
MSTDITSGIIELNGDLVLWHNEDVVFLQFHLSDIVVIGEYTNSNGPWFDDWYLTVVLKNGEWKSVPQYAGNIDQLTEELCKRFDPLLSERQLANSTNWKSVVSFPIHLRGTELFQLVTVTTYKKPANLFQTLLFSLGVTKPDTSKNIVLSEEVQKLLSNFSSAPGNAVTDPGS